MHCCQRQIMFPNESTVSDSNAFTEESEDKVTGWRHPVSYVGSNRVTLSPTFPTDQVPDMESLETCEAVRCKSDRDLPEVFFSSSVISSSSCGAAPPSRATHATAEQGMSASHLGSSRSNSLHVARTQSHASSSTTSRGDNIPAARSPPLSFNPHHYACATTPLSSFPLLRLRGGGESSLTGATSGWGAPAPGATGAGNAAGGWGTAPTQPQQQPPTQWGTGARPPGPPQPAAGLDSLDLAVSSANSTSAKSPPASAPVSGSPTAPPMPGTSTWAQAAGKNLPPAAATPPGTGSSTKQQLEQLTTMRESLFSQDGWGGQHVNQDSNWDIPASPEPGVTKDGVPVWKPNINNGTDLWEANLRNGGQPPPTVAKTPWGHTPTSNIGGTWGEDDDPADTANVWTGVPSQQQPGQPGPPQWNANQPMWPGPKKDNEWGSGGGSNWGDPRDPRGDPRGPMDPRDMRAADPRDMRGGMMGDMRGGVDMRGAGVDLMRGDPRGISGRLNGGNDPSMWGPGAPPHHHPQQQPAKMQPQPGGQWAGPPPKDGGGNKPSGWEEASPPQQRRNMPNYDDGTSLWGGQPQQSRGMGLPGKVSHWKDMPTPGAAMGRGGPGGMNCPPGMAQNRLANNGPGGMKDNNPLWMGPPRNGSWGEGHDGGGGGGGWGEEPKGGPMNSWGGGNEPPLTPNSWGGPKQGKNPGQWGDGVDMEWGHPQQKQGPKPLTKELLWASKQFRILADLGYKKEDVEAALRTSNMNMEDAIEMLRMNEPWPRHGDHAPSFDHPGGFPGGQRFNPQPMSFAPPGAVNNNQPSLANMSPAIVQKILTQQPPPQQQQQAPPAPGSVANQQAAFRQQQSQAASSQPSTAQLRMLVQQIQMAVQAGYLNHQILNQPLAPQTLLLLNQLLQQIKLLQQLTQQQQMPPMKGNSNAVLHISVKITQTKQQIANLQNQIASQQAIYVKQQNQGQVQGPGDSFFPAARPDTIAGFDQLTMRADAQVPAVPYAGQQSRLGQWKLPSLDKEAENEFSRAPGTTAKPALAASHSSPNMNPLQLGQADGTWSTVTRSNSDTGWPEAGDGDKEAWPQTSQSSAPAFTDLVPEFEPGKPWKGTQIKSSDDDPSITPGSVGRPLSLSSVKDPDNKSPTSSVDTPIPPLSLSSSTWSFTPGYSAPGKPGKTWGDAPPPTAVTSELWGAPKPASRGPPPGLNKNNNGQQANGWGGLGGRSWSSTSSGGSWGSSWLILKNLTPQIDGSTLKTLCVQHGPLQNFHLYLNHGIALAKYNTREEANKAQGALNNCVLVNTTIFAESPADSEVHSLLAHLGQQQQQPAWRPGQAKPDTWAAPSQLWPASGNSTTSTLWGDSNADHAASFLPGDLLGGESM